MNNYVRSKTWGEYDAVQEFLDAINSGEGIGVINRNGQFTARLFEWMASGNTEPLEDGNWKVEIDGNEIKFYRREQGVWAEVVSFGMSVLSERFILDSPAGSIVFLDTNQNTKTMLKPSIDQKGTVVGCPEGRNALVNNGELFNFSFEQTILEDELQLSTAQSQTGDEFSYQFKSTRVEALISGELSFANVPANTTVRFYLETLSGQLLDENVSYLQFTQGLGDSVVDGLNILALKECLAVTAGFDFILKLQFSNVIDIEGDTLDLGDGLGPRFIPRFKLFYLLGYQYTVLTEGEGALVKTVYENNADTNAFTDAEKAKLASLTGGQYRGEFADPTALRTAFPTANAGDWAEVVSTGTIWFWDVNTVDWVDSGNTSFGDMNTATYDPNAKNADAFSMDNMDETTTKKILTNTERSAISTNSNKVSFPEAPVDGKEYLRKNAGWEELVVDDTGHTIHFDANDAIYTGINSATANSRNAHPIIAFDDTTAETVVFNKTVFDTYDSADIYVDIDWVAESAVVGGVTWGVEFEKNAPSGNDIDSDAFASQQTGTSTTNATSGVITRTTIQLTQAQAGSIAADDLFRMRLQRVTGDVGDDMVNDAQIVKVSLRM